MADKTFTVGGTSVLNGVCTWRFANGAPEAREAVLIKNGHSDVKLMSLPKPMTREDGIAHLKTLGYSAADPTKLVPGTDKERAPKPPKPERKPREERVIVGVRTAPDKPLGWYSATEPYPPSRKEAERPMAITVPNTDAVREFVQQNYKDTYIQDGLVWIPFESIWDTAKLNVQMEALGLDRYKDVQLKIVHEKQAETA